VFSTRAGSFPAWTSAPGKSYASIILIIRFSPSASTIELLQNHISLITILEKGKSADCRHRVIETHKNNIYFSYKLFIIYLHYDLIIIVSIFHRRIYF
jgi:hypothetical protein